ncbi:MAG: hypothetical protein JRE58_05285 [Deltaproteobacteria bacterium]|nr:hypothetical protein [Deltaproteobacteria bacterium]
MKIVAEHIEYACAGILRYSDTGSGVQGWGGIVGFSILPDHGSRRINCPVR